MTSRRQCTGAILAGGRSMRFGGGPKGLARLGGVRLIDRVAAALRDACDDLLLIANDDHAEEWLPGVRTVEDLRPGAGALGGVHSALAAAGTDVVVLPWDVPFVPGALLRALRDAGELDAVDAAVPVSGPSSWGFEPLCAWYAQSCLPAIEAQLDLADYRAGGWQRSVNTLHVDVSSWGDPALLFYNVNTTADLIRAEQLLVARADS
jgi:molybdopterin-guanine dinucleotide biosynthesis protein A